MCEENYLDFIEAKMQAALEKIYKFAFLTTPRHSCGSHLSYVNYSEELVHNNCYREDILYVYWYNN